MKKIIAILSLAIVTSSSFAQGNVLVAANVRSVWDNFSRATSALTNDVYFALVFSTAIPTVATNNYSAVNLTVNGNGGYSVPTNALNIGASFDIATAWTDILSGNGFLMHGLGGTNLIQQINANGSVTYNSSTSFSSDNVVGGTTYFVYAIGWSSAYSTAALAAAAGSAVGWSPYFSYTPTLGIATPINMNTLISPFGVLGAAAVPEPSTIALAGLGGAALLLFRRRK